MPSQDGSAISSLGVRTVAVRPGADMRAAREQSFKSILATNEANQRRHGNVPVRLSDHSMTSSTRWRSDCGIEMPIALAVLS